MGTQKKLIAVFNPAAVMRVAWLAVIFYEWVARVTRTPAAGAVICQIDHVTPRKRWDKQKEESLLSSVYHANACQFYELSA